MPRLKTKEPTTGRRPFRNGERCRAMEAGFVAHEGGEVYWHTGDTFDADHPAVVAAPLSFMPDGIPTNEIAEWLPELVVPEPVLHDFNIPKPVPIPDERRVLCIEGLGDFARFIDRGDVVDVRDPFVKHRPESFVAYQPLTADDVERLSAVE